MKPKAVVAFLVSALGAVGSVVGIIAYVEHLRAEEERIARLVRDTEALLARIENPSGGALADREAWEENFEYIDMHNSLATWGNNSRSVMKTGEWRPIDADDVETYAELHEIVALYYEPVSKVLLTTPVHKPTFADSTFCRDARTHFESAGQVERFCRHAEKVGNAFNRGGFYKCDLTPDALEHVHKFCGRDAADS